MYLGHSQQVTVFSVDGCFGSHTVTKGPHVVALLFVVPWWQHYVPIQMFSYKNLTGKTHFTK